MRYLLDVNVLIALGLATHFSHRRAEKWFNGLAAGTELLTTPITELAFVRIIAQVSAYHTSLEQALDLLARVKQRSEADFLFLPDHLSADRLPSWVRKPQQTTDGHLLELAEAHGAQLATFDAGIPGAFLIPELTPPAPRRA